MDASKKSMCISCQSSKMNGISKSLGGNEWTAIRRSGRKKIARSRSRVNFDWADIRITDASDYASLFLDRES